MRHPILLLLLLVPACHSAEKAAEYAVKRDLRDPASAQFRNLHKNTEGVICGEVRSRSRSGVPDPYRKFMYFSHTGNLVMQPSGVPICAPGKPGCIDPDKAFDIDEKVTEFERRYVFDCR